MSAAITPGLPRPTLVEETDPPRQPPRRPLLLVANKLIVSIYKAVGFVVLTVILVGLVSFLFTKVFFLFNRSWLAPALVSPTDERVVRLNSEIVQQSTLRDKLLGERAILEANIKDTEQRVSVGTKLQASVLGAAASEARARKSERQRVRDLRTELEEVRAQVSEATGRFADLSRRSLEEQYAAGLTTRDRYAAGNLQLGQLAHTHWSLAEKQSELAARGEQLRRDADAFGSSTRAGGGRRSPLSMDALRLRQDLLRGSMEISKAQSELAAYTQAKAAIDRSVARYDELLGVLGESPLLKALGGKMTIAFVPYQNLANARPHSSVYACRLGMLICRRVGQVKQVLSGEVSVHSPIDAKNERGLMVELALEDGGAAAQEQVLFLHHAPLLF